MENFVLILLYLAIGLVMQRSSSIPAQTGLVLNQYVLYVALPALVMLNVPKLTFSVELLLPALVPWGLLVITAGLVWAVSRACHWDKATTAALLVVLPLGNTSFLGFPMVQAFFGDTGLTYAIIYDQAGSFLILASYAMVMAALFNPDVAAPSPRGIAKKILLFPAFLALLLALMLRGWTYPPLMTSFLDSLAQTLVPTIMIAVGFQFQLKLDNKQGRPLLFALITKLLVVPAIALAVVWPLDVSPLLAQVTVFEAAMPVMVTAGAVAIGANLAPRFVATLVGGSILLSLATLPLWYWGLSYLY
ncbi:hypothetical protein HMF8227_01889 [Saliniradius amylolyticus]|uniref:AEC family transporter n=1 Tax=Saliniradius amylolyticus TaxID=2183582 RepID=A0A2S2E437_9ALTE|nr:AEC family transporter [Saliniradius amylolyticus]AWL12359.1 hypothetical protein HMF8227_01889 [Saliniradius amylolyticus]